jgi:hypothetical protein
VSMEGTRGAEFRRDFKPSPGARDGAVREGERGGVCEKATDDGDDLRDVDLRTKPGHHGPADPRKHVERTGLCMIRPAFGAVRESQKKLMCRWTEYRCLCTASQEHIHYLFGKEYRHYNNGPHRMWPGWNAPPAAIPARPDPADCEEP